MIVADFRGETLCDNHPDYLDVCDFYRHVGIGSESGDNGDVLFWSERYAS